MKTKFANAIILAAAAVISTGAHAGQFYLKTYGPKINGSDVSDLVTDAYTKKYPHTKWEIVVSTSAGTTNKGIPFCTGFAGVVPRGSNDFPVRSYTSIWFDESKSVALSVGDHRDLTTNCARDAIASMMSDDPSNMYAPHK